MFFGCQRDSISTVLSRPEKKKTALLNFEISEKPRGSSAREQATVLSLDLSSCDGTWVLAEGWEL